MPPVSGRVRLGALVLSAYLLFAVPVAAWIVFMAVMFDDFFFVPPPATVVLATLVSLALPIGLFALIVLMLKGKGRAIGAAAGAHAVIALLAVAMLHSGVLRGNIWVTVLPLPPLLASSACAFVLAQPSRWYVPIPEAEA